MEEFVACFTEIVDPRDNARHDLHELLLIALCTMLTGGQDCSDMALFGGIKAPFPLATLGASLRKFLRLRHGIPSHDTFSRVFPAKPLGLRGLLDPGPFEASRKSRCDFAGFTRFMQRFARRGGHPRQDAAALLQPGCGQGAAAHAAFLVGGAAAIAGSACGRWQVQRDHGGAEAAYPSGE